MTQRDYYIENATVPIGISSDIGQREYKECNVTGTAFYLSRNNKTYLITNWHNVTGKNPETGKLLNPAFIPKVIIVRERIHKKDYAIDLYTDELKPRWIEIAEPIPFEKGTFHHIDVVAIPFDLNGIGPISFETVSNPLFQQLEPNQELMVLGYPYERERCLWKTGHIAESVQPWQPYFLINGRTKAGMSGSGVFNAGIISQQGHVLVGVYSGRIIDLQSGVLETLNELDIGIVWKLENIDKLIPATFITPRK